MSKSPTLQEDEEQFRRRIRRRNERIAALRERSGLSMDELAKLMGYKGQSSIQRYLSPDYEKGFRPEIAAKFGAALHGRGDPPITRTDLAVFDDWPETADGKVVDLAVLGMRRIEAGLSREEEQKMLEELGVEPQQSDIVSLIRRIDRMRDTAMNHRTAGLPVSEGDVVLRMPKKISKQSAETIKAWIDHLIEVASED